MRLKSPISNNKETKKKCEPPPPIGNFLFLNFFDLYANVDVDVLSSYH